MSALRLKAYRNADMGLLGDFSLQASALPVLCSLLTEIAQLLLDYD
jgi:hypothetical protein